MELQEIYGDAKKIDVVHYLVEDRQQIIRNTQDLVKRLEAICSHASLAQRWAVTLSPEPDGTSARISSPFGEAWAELTLGIRDDQVQGFWSIWHRVYGDIGSVESSMVARIRVRKDGIIYLGDANEHGLRAARNPVSGEDTAGYELMAAILYMLGEH